MKCDNAKFRENREDICAWIDAKLLQRLWSLGNDTSKADSYFVLGNHDGCVEVEVEAE